MGVDTCIEVHGVSLSDIELRKHAGDLAECIGAENFWIEPLKDQHCLMQTDEGFCVYTMWRYYGPGYERGPWMLIHFTLLWLLNKFPDAQVYYFEDHSNASKENIVTRETLNEMNLYFISSGHIPYNSVFGAREQRVTCDFCLREMMNHGGGGGAQFLLCHGCGRKFILKDNELTELEKGDDFFSGHQKIKDKNATINE